MRVNKITGIIKFQNEYDWTDFKNQIFPKLIQHFNNIGLKGIISDDAVRFNKATQKPDDFGRIWRLKDLFSIIRTADAKLFRNITLQKTLELSIDLTYLVFLSVGLGVCFCLGFAFFINDIGFPSYVFTALSIMTLTMSIGLIYIRIVLNEILNRLKD